MFVTARLCVLLALTFVVPAAAQPDVARAVTGMVTDAETAEPLAGAAVYARALQVGATTDTDGRYVLRLMTADPIEIEFSFVGFETARRVVAAGDREVSVALRPRSGEISEVAVEAAREESVMAPLAGVTRLRIEDLASLPQFLGEVDVNRGLLQLPGVASVGEGASGFNVRGGNVDQNLVLLDGSQVLFTSHLFGLFSLFNPDLVGDVTVYKGGVPARFGGRVSSVIDVRQRRARGDRVRVAGGVGLTASRLAVETPLGARASAVVGGRASYLNWILRLAERKEVKQSRASYADLGGRLDLRPRDGVTGSLSGYVARDAFRFGADTTFTYRTATGSARTTVSLGPRASVTPSATVTDYAYGFNSDDPSLAYDYRARVTHAAGAVDVVSALTGGPTLETGLSLNAYLIEPGALDPSPGSSLDAVGLERERGVEAAAYVSGTVERGGLQATLGLRASLWSRLGPATVPLLDPSLPAGTPAGSETLDGVVARYGGLEPRLALRYALGDSTAVKLGYDRQRQYVHLVSNTTAATAVDRWTLSDPLVPAQVSDQLALGVARDLPAGIRGSVDVYHRWLGGLVDYRPGAQILLNPELQADLLPGTGRAYGAEVFLRRTQGPVSGWISYAYTRAWRTVDGPTLDRQINFGDRYPASFDRPHDVSVALSWQAQPRVQWAVNFVYGTGRPITYPTGAYRVGDLVVPSYTLRNQARIPDYHRLDLSLSIGQPRGPGSERTGMWTVSVYNLYGRRNAYSIFFRQDPGTRVPQPYRLSTLGAIFPSISYAFSF